MDRFIQKNNLRLSGNPLVLCSSDESCRFEASSGGAVSGLIKYLFETGKIKHAISYDFNCNKLFYPKIVSCFEDYKITGSIYHEIDLIGFIKQNIFNISGPIVVVCLPCQVKAIQYLFKQNRIVCIVIALTCSAQQSREATYYIFDKMRIRHEDVLSLRYRGNGWPSGVQIKTKSQEYFLPNISSLWFDVFHSHIFTLRRCFYCNDTFGIEADITTADPWLSRYVNNDTLGHTLILVHSEEGSSIVNDSIRQGYLKVTESLNHEDVLASQKATLVKKAVFRKYRRLFYYILLISRSSLYMYWFRYSGCLHIHRVFFNKLISMLSKKGKI